MNNYNELLIKLIENNSKLISKKISKILIIYDRNIFFIGDTCIQLSRLKKIKKFYGDAIIDVNTSDAKLHGAVNNILLHNPYINAFNNNSWETINFEIYDVVICACIPEKKFVDFFFKRYSQMILNGTLSTMVYSASESVGFDERKDETQFFPINTEFVNYKLSDFDDKSMKANEIFITEKEQTWANNWLTTSGLLNDENLMIFIDNSSSKEKLLKIGVYFDILSSFLTLKKIKILIFDEGKIGKKYFYQEWLGEELSQKFIFAEGLSLREGIALISSRFTKFIFGPSTGLLHCASGIYNIFSQKGLSEKAIPLMIGYIGNDKINDYQENSWWGESLVDIILPVNTEANSVEIKSLKNSNYRELKNENKILECKEYTSETILNYLKKNYQEKLTNLSV